MPRLLFLPSRRALDVPRGARLIDAIRRAGLPIARSCGDGLVCGLCGVRILEGRVDPESPAELARKQQNRVDPSERLACALRVRGDLVIAARYWGEAP